MQDVIEAHGTYCVECYGPDGVLKWRDEFPNTVTVLGKNAIMDQSLSGSSYSVTGPYMGLITATAYTAISAADTGSSHTGWTESACYSGNRKTCVWSSASAGAKALSSALSFSISSGDTLKGGFVVFGSGASSTVSDTGGTLLSAGLFTGGDRTVSNGDTVSVSYSMSL